MVQVFNTLDFANKLKTAGLDSKVAEAEAELQTEFQSKIFDELEKNQAIMEQTLSAKIDLTATKTDLAALELRFDVKLEVLRSDILMKLGGLLGGGMAALGILVTVLHYAR